MDGSKILLSIMDEVQAFDKVQVASGGPLAYTPDPPILIPRFIPDTPPHYYTGACRGGPHHWITPDEKNRCYLHCCPEGERQHNDQSWARFPRHYTRECQGRLPHIVWQEAPNVEAVFCCPEGERLAMDAVKLARYGISPGSVLSIRRGPRKHETLFEPDMAVPHPGVKLWPSLLTCGASGFLGMGCRWKTRTPATARLAAIRPARPLRLGCSSAARRASSCTVSCTRR